MEGTAFVKFEQNEMGIKFMRHHAVWCVLRPGFCWLWLNCGWWFVKTTTTNKQVLDVVLNSNKKKTAKID